MPMPNILIKIPQGAFEARQRAKVLQEVTQVVQGGEVAVGNEVDRQAIQAMLVALVLLPSAMVASMLYPERRVMAICGDGGFMMNSQEIETAVRLKLNLVILVIEDNAYGMIRWKQAVDDFPDFGMTFGNPDFVKYAESYGAKGTRVDDISQFKQSLEDAFSGGGVHLVNVPVDYSENERVLVKELRERLPAILED